MSIFPSNLNTTTIWVPHSKTHSSFLLYLFFNSLSCQALQILPGDIFTTIISSTAYCCSFTAYTVPGSEQGTFHTASLFVIAFKEAWQRELKWRPTHITARIQTCVCHFKRHDLTLLWWLSLVIPSFQFHWPFISVGASASILTGIQPHPVLRCCCPHDSAKEEKKSSLNKG